MGHGHQGDPDAQQTAVEVAELQHTDLHQAEAVLILASVASVVEDREEHGEEVDDALGVIPPLDRHVDAREKEEVAQCEEQCGQQDGHVGGNL